jgi:AraC-like DNA-binding protein
MHCPAFQVSEFGLFDSRIKFPQPNRTLTAPRPVTEYELEFYTADYGSTYIDSRPYPIRRGTFLCAKPGQMRHTRLPFTCHFIHFIIREGALCDKLAELPSFIRLPDTSRIREIFSAMCERFDEGAPENELIIGSLLLELIFLLSPYARCGHRESRPSANQGIIDRAILHIEGNLSATLSLESLAAEAGFTPTYFHKLFKASVGKPLREYIEEQRLRRAVQLMVSTDMTLTEIAYECGFSSQSYFSYAFKRKMKLPPREYVRRILKKYEK